MELKRIAFSCAPNREKPVLAHLSPIGRFAPLCQATKSKKRHWLWESDPAYRADRDCINCLKLAGRYNYIRIEKEVREEKGVVFPAKFSGRCSICGCKIDKGEKIRWKPGMVRHERCFQNVELPRIPDLTAR